MEQVISDTMPRAFHSPFAAFSSGLMRLIFCVALFVSLVLGQREYTREYQLILDITRFANGREQGIEYYCGLWSDASNLDYRTLNAFNSVRREKNTDPLSVCGSNDYVRQRKYVSGDLNGVVTTEIKSVGSLTDKQARMEPFAPSATYLSRSLVQVEQDIHTCYSDFAANTRIFTQEELLINNCAEIHKLFPDAVSDTNTPVTVDEEATVTASSFRNGTFLDGKVTLDVTMFYSTVEDALADRNLRSGEFSFTIISTNGDQFSSQQTQAGIDIYRSFLAAVGSPGEYPCPDGTTIGDFFNPIPSTDEPPMVLSNSLSFFFSPSALRTSLRAG